MQLSLISFTRSALLFVVLCSSNAVATDATHEKNVTFRVFVESASSSYHCGQSEDRYLIDFSADLPFFAIFDGHNGVKAADLAKLKLKEYLRNLCILNQDIPDFSDAHIESAFERVGHDILNIKNDDSGSTATTVFFSSTNGVLYLHTANIGDSSAVLATKDEFYVLTKEHRINNKSEKERIINFIKERPKRDQSESLTNDMLRPSKARYRSAQKKLSFGEPETPETMVLFSIEAKEKEDFKEEIIAMPKHCCSISIEPQELCADTTDFNWNTKTHLEVTRCFGHRHLVREGLSCTPDICHMPIEQSAGFVILCSDGITNNLSHEDAVKLVFKGLSCGEKIEHIARNLLLEAATRERKYYYGREDIENILLTIRDDMTVIIVQFDQQL